MQPRNTSINDEGRPLIRTHNNTQSRQVLNNLRKLALATANTLTGVSPILGTLTFVRLFPNVAPKTVPYLLGASLVAMPVSSAIGIADTTETQRLQTLRQLWKAFTSGSVAYTFSFALLAGLYVSTARAMGYTDQEIDSGLADEIAFITLTTTSAALGVVHSATKFKNDRRRNQIALARQTALTENELPLESTSLLTIENFTNGFVIGSALHALWMNIEIIEEGGQLNASPYFEIPRYSVPLTLGAIAFVVNILFKNKPAALINEFTTYLNAINIATMLGFMLKSDMEDGKKLDEEAQQLFLIMWPTLIAIPLLYKIGETFLRCFYKQHAAISDVGFDEENAVFGNSITEEDAQPSSGTETDIDVSDTPGDLSARNNLRKTLSSNNFGLFPVGDTRTGDVGTSANSPTVLKRHSV